MDYRSKPKVKPPLSHSASPPVFAGPAYELSMNLLARQAIKLKFEKELLERHLAFNVVLVFEPQHEPNGRSNLNTKRNQAREAALAAQRKR